MQKYFIIKFYNNDETIILNNTYKNVIINKYKKYIENITETETAQNDAFWVVEVADSINIGKIDDSYKQIAKLLLLQKYFKNYNVKFTRLNVCFTKSDFYIQLTPKEKTPQTKPIIYYLFDIAF